MIKFLQKSENYLKKPRIFENILIYKMMKKSEKKWSNGMKILGVSLLLLAVPGSTIVIPALINNFVKNRKSKDEDNKEEFLGI